MNKQDKNQDKKENKRDKALRECTPPWLVR